MKLRVIRRILGVIQPVKNPIVDMHDSVERVNVVVNERMPTMKTINAVCSAHCSLPFEGDFSAFSHTYRQSGDREYSLSKECADFFQCMCMQ